MSSSLCCCCFVEPCQLPSVLVSLSSNFGTDSLSVSLGVSLVCLISARYASVRFDVLRSHTGIRCPGTFGKGKLESCLIVAIGFSSTFPAVSLVSRLVHLELAVQG